MLTRVLVWLGWAVFVGGLASTAAAEGRAWTSADGKFKIQAEFVRLDGDAVVLKRDDNGQEVTVPLAKLSPTDQAVARTSTPVRTSTAGEDPFDPRSRLGSVEERKTAAPTPNLVSGSPPVPPRPGSAAASAGETPSADAPSPGTASGPMPTGTGAPAGDGVYTVAGMFSVAEPAEGPKWHPGDAGTHICGDLLAEPHRMALVAALPQDVSGLPPEQRVLVATLAGGQLAPGLAGVGVTDVDLGTPTLVDGQVHQTVTGQGGGKTIRAELRYIFAKKLLIFAAIGFEEADLAPMTALAATVKPL